MEITKKNYTKIRKFSLRFTYQFIYNFSFFVSSTKLFKNCNILKLKPKLTKFSKYKKKKQIEK